MVFHQTEIGTIPTSMDEVMIGSAAMLRASNPKYVLILGLCEGEFPATVNEIGLFSSGDRSKLSELGLTLSNDSNIRSSDELMYVQRAFSAPSHGLFLFTSTSDAGGKSRNLSLALNRVLSLFEALTPHRFSGDDLRYLVGAPRSSVGHLRNLGNSKEAIALREALSEHLQDVKKLSVAESSTPTCRISGETAAEVTGSTIRFSSSRFEKYVECPFNYYCTYVLGLREKKQANFRVSQMGTFVHFILEQLLKFAITLDENGERPDDETLIKRTEETVAEYIEKICPTEYRHSRRLNHLYTRLKRLSLLMVRNIVEEFSQSDFEPAFFELNTNGKDGNPTPMEFVLEDGCRVSFAGIIDRVDLLKKDDEVYIRIVDYKTGTKVFSTKDVDRGINIQMLLYLFTLCRNTNAEFKKRIGLPEEKSPIPAGIMYLSANVPVIQVEQYEEEQSILKKASDSLKRSGLILNDEEILRAMNHNLSPKFLAGIKKNEKDGQLTGNALTSSETFQSLWEQIQSVVEKITADLRGGIADATPIQHKATSPCSYCKMKPICRKTDH